MIVGTVDDSVNRREEICEKSNVLSCSRNQRYATFKGHEYAFDVFLTPKFASQSRLECLQASLELLWIPLLFQGKKTKKKRERKGEKKGEKKNETKLLSANERLRLAKRSLRTLDSNVLRHARHFMIKAPSLPPQLKELWRVTQSGNKINFHHPDGYFTSKTTLRNQRAALSSTARRAAKTRSMTANKTVRGYWDRSHCSIPVSVCIAPGSVFSSCGNEIPWIEFQHFFM